MSEKELEKRGFKFFKLLVDLCITNSPEKITNSGVIHLGISDHSLVFLSRKTQYCRTGPRVIETR